MKTEKEHGVGIEISTGSLFVTLLVLKLTGVIDWSWWWVSAPLWFPIAGGALFLVLAIGIVLFALGVIVAWEAWDRMTWRREKHHEAE